MNRQILWLLLVPGLCACPSQGTSDGGGDSGNPGPPANFGISVLDSTPNDLQPISMAVRPDDSVSVAYFLKVGTYTQGDGGTVAGSLYDLRYIEWKAGQGSAPISVSIATEVDAGVQVHRQMKRVEGVSVAIQANSQPAIAFMGGNDLSQNYWYQHEAYLAWRDTSGSWTSEAVVSDSTQVTPNNRIGGFLVGVWPALVFDGANAYYGYRDGHYGQFPIQDWQASDTQICHGWGPGASWNKVMINDPDVFGKNGYGGHNQMVMANGQPAVVYDSIPGGAGDAANGIGSNVFIQRRNSDGTWTAPFKVTTATNTQLGPSFAFDSSLGFAVAVIDHSSDQLSFMSSTTGGPAWTVPDPVWQSGSGGWYPSLAINPFTHAPHVANYYCDARSGINDLTQCQKNVLQISYQTPAGNWQTQVVDTAGGWSPKLGFLSSGKRVVVYLQPNGSSTGQLKIAVEQ